MGVKNFNIFEINELCISTRIICNEPCEVVPKIKEETILSQKGDQCLEEIVVPELDNEDKEKLSNLRKYDEELEML